MEKTRELRSGASRFFSPMKRKPKQSQSKITSVLNGGGFADVDLSERSKREKVRGSNLVDRESSRTEDNEITGSDGEEEFRLPQIPQSITSKGLKLHREMFDDCNAVDPAAVPRKLRSAMNKRNRESTSPPFPDAKKLHQTFNGVDSPQLKNYKKTRLKMKQEGISEKSLKQSISGPVTEEEEEVAEALFALARISPKNNPLKAKSSPFPETMETPMPTSITSEVENAKVNSSANAEATNLSSSVEGSSHEDSVIKPLLEPAISENPTSPKNKKLGMVLQSSTDQVDLQRSSLFYKNVCTTPLSNTPSLSAPVPELRLKIGLTQPKKLEDEAPLPEIKQKNLMGEAISEKQEHQNTIMEKMENGREGIPALWPGLSITRTSTDEVHGPSLRYSSAKAPYFPDTTICATEPSSSSNGVPTEKVSSVKVVDRRKTRKRCVTHVFISSLIQAYQATEFKGKRPGSPNPLKPNEGTKSSIVRNTLNEVIPSSTTNGSTVENNLSKARNDLTLEKRLEQNQHASTTSGIYTLQKQCCDFLSLSAIGGGLEDNSNSQVGNKLDSSGHVPYMHSIVRHQDPLMPFPFPQTRYSTPYADQLTAQQVQLQLPQFLVNPYGALPLGHASHAKQELQPHHQLLAAQYSRSAGGNPGSHLQKWQTGRHDPASLIPLGPAIFTSTLQQQPQPQRVFPISSPSHVQLLCNSENL